MIDVCLKVYIFNRLSTRNQTSNFTFFKKISNLYNIYHTLMGGASCES